MAVMAKTDWKYFPCSADDPTAWIDGSTAAASAPPAPIPTPSRTRRRRASGLSFFSLATPGQGPNLADVRLEARVCTLLGLSSLDRPPDCRMQQYRPGQLVHAHGKPGPGLPLAVVLNGAAVIVLGGRVVDKVCPGGCIGGAQFILQV